MVGFFVPGETAVILGGVLASFGHVLLWVVLIVAVGAAVAGDSVGYVFGSIFGPWLLSHKPLKGHKAVKKSTDFLDRRGGSAVFLGRFVAIVRALIPGLAGVAKLEYRRFLIANAAGGILWACGYTILGYIAGSSYAVAAHYSTFASIGFVIAVAILFAVYHLVFKRRKEKKHEGLKLQAEAARDA